jgi:hypothetical protein
VELMPFYVELPDHAGVRRRTPKLPWVVFGLIHDGYLRITVPTALAGSRPVAQWVPVPGPARPISEAEWVRLLQKAEADEDLVAAALATLSPLERAELEERAREQS